MFAIPSESLNALLKGIDDIGLARHVDLGALDGGVLERLKRLLKLGLIEVQNEHVRSVLRELLPKKNQRDWKRKRRRKMRALTQAKPMPEAPPVTTTI